MNNGTTRNLRIATSLCFLISTLAHAQLVEFPISTSSQATFKSNLQARTQSATPVFLPFWDDFSSSDSLLKQNLWLFGNSVFLNNGIGIRPPSRNVVTFDGVDSLGKPYNINDLLAKGFADKLESQPIRMDVLAPALRNTVYLSFFYQVEGRGEPPDNGDNLTVSIKDQNGKWNDIYVLENNATLQRDVFYQVLLPISDPKYFHASFQFRFSNFARLSGPYDTWNVDYVFLSSGRSATDAYYPDRTISSSITSLFANYFAMPAKHFLEDPAGNLKHPSLELFNLKLVDVPSGLPHQQNINYTTQAVITTKVGTLITSNTFPLDSFQFAGIIKGLEYLNISLNKIPATAAFNPMADSIHIRLKYGMSTKDNIAISSSGDYDPAKYSPIDFRVNDTIRADYLLSSYYAYDDGIAEYAAGLNQAGSFLAFLFNVKYSKPDTLVYVDIYFPEFGENTSQSLQLQIRSDLTDNPASILLEQNIVVDRKTRNKFSHYPLTHYVLTNGPFYVGWKQLSNTPIAVGLDKNTDNGNKIFYNTNGLWIQNSLVKGSIMVRAGFGKAKGNVVTGLESGSNLKHLYPNPSNQTFYLPATAENILAFDMTGKRIDLERDTDINKIRLTFLSHVGGLVIVRYFFEGRWSTEKLMVRPE